MMLLQRAALLSALIVLALTAAIASPAKSINRKKREDSSDFDNGFYHSSSFSSSFNGDGHVSSDYYPWRGVYSTRVGNPFMWPWMSFPTIVPWYKGENVCKDTKYADQPQVFKDMAKGLQGGFMSGGSRRESCEGRNGEYICWGREIVDGEVKMYMTVYSCCHGFVRNPSAPGCIEKPKGKKPSVEDGPTNSFPNDEVEVD